MHRPERSSAKKQKIGLRADWTGRLATALPLALALAAVLAIAEACALNRETPVDPAVLELIGPDDGSHVAIFYGSEIMGSLDGCGCMGNPKLGGFPFRLAVSSAFGEAFPEVGVLQVDAGFTASLITNQQGLVSPEAEAAFGSSIEALVESGFAAANITSSDIPFARKYLGADGGEPRFAGMFVSANLEPVSPLYRAPARFVVREVRRPGGKGTVKVAVVGVTEFPGRLDPASGYRVTDPRKALGVAIGEARAQSELVVVLAYMPSAAAGTLFAGLETKPDVVVVANSFGAGSADGSVMGSGLEPQLDGPMKIVYSWYKTQKLGILRLKLDDANRVVSAANTYVKLDAPIVPDPAGERMVARQKDAVRAAKEARYRAEGVQATNTAP